MRVTIQQLIDNKKLWMTVSHEKHRSLGKFIDLLSPGFTASLKSSGIICAQCEMESLEGFVSIQDQYLIERQNKSR